VIAVNYAVARHLGREPTHAGLVATQRAARRLTERYQVRIAHISSDRVTSRGAAVIAREDQRITDGQLVQAAKKRLPELGEQPPSPIADQLIDPLCGDQLGVCRFSPQMMGYRVVDGDHRLFGESVGSERPAIGQVRSWWRPAVLLGRR
jgi:hypothetical protein